jgi:hypothetical protein
LLCTYFPQPHPLFCLLGATTYENNGGWEQEKVINEKKI